MDESKRMAVFSLLAHIGDQKSRHLKDLSDIFSPFVKKALCELYASNHPQGQISDIHNELQLIYTLDMPFGLIRMLLNKIKSVSVTSDGAYKINDIEFGDTEEKFLNQAGEVDKLIDAYNDFVIQSGREVDKEPTLFSFIDQHRLGVSKLLTGNITGYKPDREELQALFINSIKNNLELFNILKRIYIGSIIACYLDIQPTKNRFTEVELVADTSFIISLLNLRSEEANRRANSLFTLASNSNYRFVVLDTTLDETKSLIAREAQGMGRGAGYCGSFLNSIAEYCESRNFGHSEMMVLASSLEQKLRKNFKFRVEISSDELKRKTYQNSDCKEILNRTFNNDGALADALAVCYIIGKGVTRNSNFWNVSAWFLTDSDEVKRINSARPYEIKASNLLNIIWMANPSTELTLNTLADEGLAELVTKSLNPKMGTIDQVRKLSEKLSKLLEEKEIDSEQLVILQNMLSARSCESLEELDEVQSFFNSEGDSETLNHITKLSKMYEKKQKKLREKTLELSEKTSQQNKIISQQKKKLKKQSKEKINIEAKYQEEVKGRNLLLKEEKVKKTILREDAVNAIEYAEATVQKMAARFEELKSEAKSKAQFFIKIILIVLFVGALSCLGFAFLLDWSTYEKGFTIIVLMVSVTLFFVRSIFFNRLKVGEWLQSKLEHTLKKKYIATLGLPQEEISRMKAKLEKHKKRVRR